MGCGCGKNKTSSTTTYQHLTSEGEVIPTADGQQTYTSEMDARMAAASQPGTRVRPVG